MNDVSEIKSIKADNGAACNVCGGPNAAIRYGAVCCPSCAAFFARTTRKLGREPYRCPMTLPCSVKFTIKRRCKACRLRKCHDNRMRLPPKYAHVLGYQPNTPGLPSHRGTKRPKADQNGPPTKLRSLASDNTELKEQRRGVHVVERAREWTLCTEQRRIRKREECAADMSHESDVTDEMLLDQVDKILTENGHFLDSILGTAYA